MAMWDVYRIAARSGWTPMVFSAISVVIARNRAMYKFEMARR
jgi:hypothetical protein